MIPSRSRNHAFVALQFTLPFLALLLLITLDLARHADAASALDERDIQVAAFPETVRDAVRALPHLGGPSLSDRAVNSLHIPGPLGFHRRLRPILLPTVFTLRYDRERLEHLYLNRARIPLPSGGKAVGFTRGSSLCFGLPVDRLTVGEAATLLTLSLTPVFQHPDSLLVSRQDSLERLKAAGILSPAAFEDESARPLVLAPNHVPIW
jgi:hypothetical protein